jgi:glycosyltransferase involved in cell wall biosynthesis
MVAALRREGVEAALVASDDDGAGRLNEPTGRWIEHRGVPVQLFPRWRAPIRPLRDFAWTPALASWLEANLSRWDLLHVHSLFSWPSSRGMAIARRLHTPYLIHCLGHLQPWSLDQSAWRKRLFLALFERRNLQGAAALQATSTMEAADFHRLRLHPPVYDLPLGVPLPDLRDDARRELQQALPALDPEAVRLLFLSRLHPKKGLERLLQALALLRRSQPARPWQLLIAGSGEADYERRLRALATELGLADRCLWLGFVQGESKDRLLQGSDWFVLPSSAENFGIAVAEALAAATPVVVSPQVGLAPAVAEASAGLLSPLDPSELAATLSQALEQPRLPLSLAARRLAEERYGWPAIACRMIRSYEQILRAHG